jgi:hypothetical protein
LRQSVFARFAMCAVPLYLGYVAKIGGDFMLGRLLCSVMPILFLAAEVGVRALFERASVVPGVAALAALAPVALPNGVAKPGEKYLDIADERTFYPLESFEPITVSSWYTAQARKLKRMFKSAPRPPKLAIGAVGIVGYVTRYPLMDTLGLVNRDVARMKIRVRGRPGHEKIATPGHIFAYGVDFSDVDVWPKEYAKWTLVRIADGDFWVAKYDPRFASKVRADGTRLPDIEDRIRTYDPSERSLEKVMCDLWFFDQIYFSHREDDALRTRLSAKVVEFDASLEGLSELMLGRLPEAGSEWQKQVLFSFDDLRGFAVTGDAFAGGPVEHEAVGQARVFGAKGRFLNSYGEQTADAAKGTLRSPKFRLSGDALTLWIGGGKSRRTSVRLLVEGDAVASATGCETDVLGRRVFPTRAHRGKEAVIEIVDRGDRGWDHLVVDEIVEWKRLR